MDLESTLHHLRERGEGAHMPHVYYGDPHEAFSQELIHTLSYEADLLEFGIPFSDPTADGPTFQLACERALPSVSFEKKASQSQSLSQLTIIFRMFMALHHSSKQCTTLALKRS
jgi:tryptophan synthase alpha subunit